MSERERYAIARSTYYRLQSLNRIEHDQIMGEIEIGREVRGVSRQRGRYSARDIVRASAVAYLVGVLR